MQRKGLFEFQSRWSDFWKKINNEFLISKTAQNLKKRWTDQFQFSRHTKTLQSKSTHWNIQVQLEFLKSFHFYFNLLNCLVTEKNILPCGTGFPFLFIEMTYFLFESIAVAEEYKKNLQCNKIFKLFNRIVLHIWRKKKMFLYWNVSCFLISYPVVKFLRIANLCSGKLYVWALCPSHSLSFFAFRARNNLRKFTFIRIIHGIAWCALFNAIQTNDF